MKIKGTSCPQPEMTIVPPPPCDIHADNDPNWDRCPDYEYCKRHGTECRAFRDYINSRDPENALMHRQFEMKLPRLEDDED